MEVLNRHKKSLMNQAFIYLFYNSAIVKSENSASSISCTLIFISPLIFVPSMMETLFAATFPNNLDFDMNVFRFPTKTLPFCLALNIKFFALIFSVRMDSSTIVNVDFASMFPQYVQDAIRLLHRQCHLEQNHRFNIFFAATLLFCIVHSSFEFKTIMVFYLEFNVFKHKMHYFRHKMQNREYYFLFQQCRFSR